MAGMLEFGSLNLGTFLVTTDTLTLFFFFSNEQHMPLYMTDEWQDNLQNSQTILEIVNESAQRIVHKKMGSGANAPSSANSWRKCMKEIGMTLF
jgi:hypothetical protein